MALGGYRDDPAIPDEAQLFRRIPPWHFIRDENVGKTRPSSAAFEDHPNGSPMSVILADTLAETGRIPETILAGHEGFALVTFSVELARECGQGVARDPLPDEPAHAVVFGKKTQGVKKKLARGASWVVKPSEADETS